MRRVGAVVLSVVSAGFGLVVPAALVRGGAALDATNTVMTLASLVVAVWAAGLAKKAWRLQSSDRPAAVLRGELAHAASARYRGVLAPDATMIDTPYLAYVTGHSPSRSAGGGGSVPGGTRQDVVTRGPVGAGTRVVVVGARGAGKTEFASWLAMAGAPLSSGGEVVVAWVPLSTYDPAVDLRTWLARQVARDSALDEASVAELWTGGQLVPVLDGLDEMDPPGTPVAQRRAHALLERLNEPALAATALDAAAAPQLGYVARGNQGLVRPPVILTCGDTAWTELQRCEPLLEAWRFELQPVPAAVAEDYVKERSGAPERWRLVVEHLVRHPSSPLALALRTPWRLHLAVTAFDEESTASGARGFERHPSALLAPGSPDAVRDILLEHYIPAVVDRAAAAPYTSGQVTVYLRGIATWLVENAGSPPLAGRALPTTDFTVRELWPLAGRVLPRAVGAALVAGVTTAACGLLAAGAQGPWTAGRWCTLAASALLGVGLAVGALTMAWPGVGSTGPGPGPRPGASRQRPPHRASVARWAAAAAAAGAIGGGSGWWIGGRAAAGVLSGLASACAVVVAGPRTTPGRRGAEAVLRSEASAGAGVALVGAAVTTTWWGLVFGSAATGPALLFAAGLGLASCPVCVRHAVLIVRTRRGDRRLPWRPVRFLRWAAHAGLLREIGGVYQVRHRELQEYLAPPSAP